MSCYRAVGMGHKALTVVYMHLKNIEYNIDSPLAGVPIDLLPNKIEA